jgi:hypothetical protein
VPFPEFKASAIVTRNIIDGKQPRRPPKGKKLIRFSLAHETKKRPPVETPVEFLEKAIADVAMLKGLTEFDANSEGDIQKLRNMSKHGGNALFGM